MVKQHRIGNDQKYRRYGRYTINGKDGFYEKRNSE